MKHALKARHYIRYCDDFVILRESRVVLEKLIENLSCFLRERLLLELHPRKVTIRKLRQGTDFLGYVSLQHFHVLRTRTKQRMFRKCGIVFAHRNDEAQKAYARRVLRSYKGLLSHGREYRSWKRLEKLYGE